MTNTKRQAKRYSEEDTLPRARSAFENASRILIWVPVLVTMWYVDAFGVDFPYMDDWAFVPSVVNLFSGGLSWQDIYRQHNDSKVPFFQIVQLALARMTHFNLRAEMFASFAFLTGSLILLYVFYKQLRSSFGLNTLYFLPVSLVFLNWRQYEGLLWGIHLANTMGLFFLLLSLYYCFEGRRLPAVMAGVTASFSVAMGLMVWPMGLLGLLLSEKREGLNAFGRLWRVAPWVTAAILTAGAFFHGYEVQTVPWPTGFGLVLERPLEVARYSMVYLGSGFAGNSLHALWMGILLSAFALCALWLGWRGFLRQKQALPFVSLIVLVLMSLTLLIRSRLGLGVDQAFSASRYVTSSSLFAVGVYGLLLAVKETSPAAKIVFRGFLLYLAFGVWTSYSVGLGAGKRHLTELSSCSEVVRCFRRQDDRSLLCAYIAPPVVREQMAGLERHNLSLFRDGSQRCESR